MKQIRGLLREGRLDEAWSLYEQAPATAEVPFLGSMIARAKHRATVNGPDNGQWRDRARCLSEQAVALLDPEP